MFESVNNKWKCVSVNDYLSYIGAQKGSYSNNDLKPKV